MFMLSDENKERFEDFYRHESTDKVWFLQTVDERGPIYFSFDRKKVYSFFEDYPDMLSPEERAVFDKENSVLSRLKSK